jgi:hypothetical protein
MLHEERSLKPRSSKKYDSGKNIFTKPGVIAELPDESGGRRWGDIAFTENVSTEKPQL